MWPTAIGAAAGQARAAGIEAYSLQASAKGFGMHSYWYVSQDKLHALGAFDRGWLSRLRPNAKVGLGAASVGIDVEPASTRTLNRAAARAEQQLRGERLISDVAGFTSGTPPAQYFESNGPASRAVIENMLWVAGVDDEVAVLLVGSASNAVGARHAHAPSRRSSPSADPVGAARYVLEHPEQLAVAAEDVFSPSMDPIGAARYLLEHQPQRAGSAADRAGGDAGQAPERDVEAQIRAGTLAYAWEALMRRSLDLLGDDISALPQAHSVSLYVARHRMEGPGHGWQAGLKSLVLGTPLYIEQSK